MIVKIGIRTVSREREKGKKGQKKKAKIIQGNTKKQNIQFKYIHICIYIYICIHIHVCMHVHIYAYIYMCNIYIYMCMYG